MPYILQFRPHARELIGNSYSWYEEQQAGLGEEFLDELTICFDSIKANPLMWAKLNRHFRQAVVKRFPFVVTFTVKGNEITVYSVFHTSRHPKGKTGGL